MTEKHRCAGTGWHGRLGLMPCSRNGKIEEDGEWWCHSHAPSKVAERSQLRDDAYHARQVAQRNTEQRANQRAAELTEQLGIKVDAEAVYSVTGPFRILRYRFVLRDETMPVEQ